LPEKVVKTVTGDHGTVAIPATHGQKVRVWMQVFVSTFMLAVGILALASPNFLFHSALDEGTKKWAAGGIGSVIGYWLS
jgi:hypothetical protein